MSTWISENKSIATILGIGAVAFLGITVFGTKQLLVQMDYDTKYKNQASDIESATQSSIPPTKEALEQRKASLEQYKALAESTKAEYQSFIPKKEEITNVAPDQFRTKLQATSNAFKAAAAEQKVKLPEGFLLGFESYATTPPLQQATGILLYELSAIDWLMNAAIKNHTTEVIRIFRARTPLEDAASAAAEKAKNAKEGKPKTELFSVAVTLKGTRESVRRLVNEITNNDKYLFLIRAMQSKNEKAGAVTITPPAIVAPKNEKEKPAGGAMDFNAAMNAAAKDANKPKDEKTAAKTPASEVVLKPVVGNEMVEIHLVLDLVLFPQPQANASQKKAVADEKSE